MTIRNYCNDRTSGQCGAVATVLLAYVLILLAGCGGGGGGSGSGGSSGPPPAPTISGNGPAPSSGPGDTSLYFPAGQGDVWSYNFVTDDPAALIPSTTVGIAVNGTKVVHGITGAVFVRTDATVSGGGSDQYFTVSGGGVTLLGSNNLNDLLTPLIAPYVQQLFPVQVGVVSLVTGKNVPDSALSIDLTQTITNNVVESVDTPAGTFANALRQTTTRSVAISTGSGAPNDISSTELAWYVPGIGQVKDAMSVTSNGSTVRSTAELRGYAVNGQAHGLGTAVQITAPITGMCLSAFGLPVIGSDGTNFIVIYENCTTASGAFMYQWVATLIGPDGSVITSTNLSGALTGGGGGYAVVSFDGTNYLVVHEDDSSGPSGPAMDAVLVSRKGAIVSGPTVVGNFFYNNNLPGNALALGFDGARYLLVFTNFGSDQVGPLSGLYLSPATGAADGAPFPITSNDISYLHDQPVVAFDGTNYLVVWFEETASPPGLRAARISKSGTVLDSTPIVLANAANDANCCGPSPTVSFDGTNYLVAYREFRATEAGTTTASIFAARVSPAGVLLDGTADTPGISVGAAAGGFDGAPIDAFINGATWLAWGVQGTSSLINATRVSTSGTVSSNWPNGFPLVNEPLDGFAGLNAMGASATGGMLIGPHSSLNPGGVSLWAMPIYSAGP